MSDGTKGLARRRGPLLHPVCDRHRCDRGPRISVRGFRSWDAVPGLLICDHRNCYCVWRLGRNLGSSYAGANAVVGSRRASQYLRDDAVMTVCRRSWNRKRGRPAASRSARLSVQIQRIASGLKGMIAHAGGVEVLSSIMFLLNGLERAERSNAGARANRQGS
jgi:hypothetical protein